VLEMFEIVTVKLINTHTTGLCQHTHTHIVLLVRATLVMADPVALRPGRR
jgi:hypothetical protein